MKITRWDGGLSTRLDPSLIQSNQGRQYINVNPDAGTLNTLAEPKFVANVTSEYIIQSRVLDTLLTFDSYARAVDLNLYAYSVDGVQTLYHKSDSESFELGIEKPYNLVWSLVATERTAPITEPVFVVYNPPGVAQLPGDGFPPGIYKYKVKALEPGNIEGATVNTAVVRNSQQQDVLRYTNYFEVAVDTLGDGVRVVVGGASQYPVGTIWFLYRWFNGEWKQVRPDLFNQLVTEDIEDVDIDISASPSHVEITLLSGTYTYAYTYYNTSTGAESPPILSDEITVLDGIITIIDIVKSNDPEVDAIRIYRVGGVLTDFSLVEEIPNPVSDFVTYVDSTADLDIPGDLLRSADWAPAPVGDSIITAYAMLFITEGRNLRFSLPEEPWAWSEFNFIGFSSDITGIAVLPLGIVVMTEVETHLVTGTGPDTFTRQLIAANFGCVDFKSVRSIEGTAVWLSYQGLCITNGSTVKLVSYDALDYLEGLIVTDSIIQRNAYHLVTTTNTLVFDLVSGTFRNLTHSTGFKGYYVEDDNLYSIVDSTVHGGLSNFIHYSKTPDSYKALGFQSMDFTSGDLTAEKTYDKFKIFVDCEVDQTVEVDVFVGKKATSKVVGPGFTEINLQTGAARGYSLSYIISIPAHAKETKIRAIQWDEVSANG